MDEKLRQSMLKNADSALRANGLQSLQDAIDVVNYVNSEVQKESEEKDKKGGK